ncbi:hypothetical protein QVD17_19805 [Tagetes erecta]|uniref:Uncharacterized protein n=1 Tax=Tagetes erecta TaxID=13708 RepID=A0AAD8KK41_TARER|nr:hypothetical protein QVD17_19805 [Tagetes erecta]
MEFCIQRSKEVFESFGKKMTDTHGVDLTQHFFSDIEVCWCRVVDGRKHFVIGSLDPLFVFSVRKKFLRVLVKR